MDFNDTPQEAAFRQEAAEWLAANVPTQEETKGMNRLEVAKMWQKRKYDAGWACIGWDPKYGGRGATSIEQVIWKQEEGKYDVPASFFVIGQGMMAPTLMAYADQAALDRYLPKLASGEEIWCQLFQNLPVVPTLRPCGPRQSAMVTTGSSTVRKSGPRVRTTQTTVVSLFVLTRLCQSTRA